MRPLMPPNTSPNTPPEMSRLLRRFCCLAWIACFALTFVPGLFFARPVFG